MYLKIPIQLIVAILLVACSEDGSDQHSMGVQAVDPSPPAAAPALDFGDDVNFETSGIALAAQIKLGRTLHAKILDKYPRLDKSYRKAFLWGGMTSQPMAVISIPTKDWPRLSKEDKDALGAYAASFVDVVRAFPFEFTNFPESSPIASAIRENAAAMTSTSWGIMIGAISPDGRGVMADDFAARGQ